MNTPFLIAVVVLIAAGITAALLYRPKKPRHFESVYTDALNAIVHGDNKTALRLLREVVKRDTNHINAYLQMGEILRAEGNPHQAIKIHQSLTVRPNLENQLQIDIHRSLALDYMEVQNYVKAKNEAEFILKIEKKNIWALEFLLDLAEQQHDWIQAAAVAKDIQKITQQKDPGNLAKFQMFEGLDHLGKNDRERAKKCFVKAIEIDSTYGQAHERLGDFYADDRDLIKAIDHWEKFAHLDVENASNIFTKMETALYDLGRYGEVEKFYKRLLDKNPGNLDALARMANVLEEKGERQQALDLVDTALKQFEDSVHTRLMKLKLSLTNSPPHELSRQIDKIIDLITENKEIS
ncbi:MAG TPA: tetratricopeptide repeat protein [Candidatus Marinimicrobia bacterium]|nr:tetratricopeptide repeat protein [Candidatus Neomarinimicrobiota bacterium]